MKPASRSLEPTRPKRKITACPLSQTPSLSRFNRIVVKVGSSLIVDSSHGSVKEAWLEALVADIADLHRRGASVLVVSSGAIALGRTIAGLPKGTLKLEDSQASAAIGQIALASAWSQALAKHAIVAGQILLTLQDTEERRRYLNARATIARLIAMRAVPVINENDTVATSEIRYGDNDRLAARLAAMASADLLILLSDVAGLYDAPPSRSAHARLLPVVERVTPEIETMAGGAATELSRGGMRTKIEAARIATAAGAHMLIADGRVMHPIARVAEGGRCTWFLTPSNPIAARKIWISGSLELKGAVFVDAGAATALASGKSLLPAGVTRVEGVFSRGDCVAIRNERGVEIGRGLIAYDALHAERIRGRKSRDIAHILGTAGRAEMIHRDDMALADPSRRDASRRSSG
ncbi:MAG: glutamate 5-kinase [Hyphomicrobiales bacterium]|nr:glutamate 5-kinase [Hyphomicrobiales bacterium]